MPSTNNPIPAQLTVVAWPDTVVDAVGFLPHDPYSELVWTPTLGPSALLAWRRMAGTLIHRPDGYTLDVATRPRPGPGHRHCPALPRVPDAPPPGGVWPRPLRRREHLRRAPPHPAGVGVAAAPSRP